MSHFKLNSNNFNSPLLADIFQLKYCIAVELKCKIFINFEFYYNKGGPSSRVVERTQLWAEMKQLEICLITTIQLHSQLSQNCWTNKNSILQMIFLQNRWEKHVFNQINYFLFTSHQHQIILTFRLALEDELRVWVSDLLDTPPLVLDAGLTGVGDDGDGSWHSWLKPVSSPSIRQLASIWNK